MHTESIVLGGGCFWCTEAVFRRTKGVTEVVPGYAGGRVPQPTYDEVSSGMTGHAETIRVTFDPDATSLRELLALFFAAHDPTTKDRQGADVGEQYRSIILWTDEAQRDVIDDAIRTAQAEYDRPIVTEAKPLDAFYPAEITHQQYYEKNPNAAYCSVVIAPKLEKLRGLLKA
jgi:peptide-methionine (S)-S-oxide reductase